MKNVTNQAVRAAIDDCLSGVESMPSVRAQVLNQVRGEVKVKKKLSVGIVFAMLLTVLMAGAALAAGLGLFGQIGERENSDARLPALERVAESVGASFTTDDGVTITIDQAYYDGNRVFISYTKTGPFDLLSMGEGIPENLGECDWALPGEKFGDSLGIDGPDHQLMVAHLDGSAPRWAKRVYVNTHDGLRSGDTDLEIIGGETYLMEDGTLVGWKECVVPEEIAAEELVVSIGTFTTATTYYQDETGLYLYYGDCPAAVWHPFTVKKDTTGGQQLVGESAGEGWTAQATLTASAIDIKGELVLSCPQDWVEIERTWENPKGLNYIAEWHVYMDGVRDKDGGVEWVSSGVDSQLTFGLCCKVDAAVTTIQLVPVYSKTGESMAEAITLKIAE